MEGNPSTPAEVLRALGIDDHRDFSTAQLTRTDPFGVTDDASNEASRSNSQGTNLDSMTGNELPKRRAIPLELPGQ